MRTLEWAPTRGEGALQAQQSIPTGGEGALRTLQWTPTGGEGALRALQWTATRGEHALWALQSTSTGGEGALWTQQSIPAVGESKFDTTKTSEVCETSEVLGHAGIRRAQKFLRNHRFVLKCDIKKYFPSIDHELLKGEIRRKIADPDALWLIDTIIDNSNEQEFVHDFFPGDDLFTALQRRKGLPLGNLTSQFFANVFLSRFDHFVKEELKVKCYARYVDDFLCVDNDLNFLKGLLSPMQDYLNSLRLKLHPRKCHILRSDKGVLFLGQVIYPDYRLLKKQNIRRFCQRMKRMERELKMKEITEKRFNASIAGWLGHAGQADTFRLRQDLEKKYEHLELNLTIL